MCQVLLEHTVVLHNEHVDDIESSFFFCFHLLYALFYLLLIEMELKRNHESCRELFSISTKWSFSVFVRLSHRFLRLRCSSARR